MPAKQSPIHIRSSQPCLLITHSAERTLRDNAYISSRNHRNNDHSAPISISFSLPPATFFANRTIFAPSQTPRLQKVEPENYPFLSWQCTYHSLYPSGA